MLLQFPPDWPRYREGSSLMKMPELTPYPHPPTEAEEIILTHARPFYSDPDTLFPLVDGLMLYYQDELTT